MQIGTMILCLCFLIQALSLCRGQETQLRPATPTEASTTLKLKATLPNRQLLDVAKDGSFLLFRLLGSDKLIRYRLQTGTRAATRTTPKQNGFIVHDRATGEDIGMLQSSGNLRTGTFMPDGKTVLVQEDYIDGRFSPHNQMWSLNTDTPGDICHGDLRIQRGDFWPLSGTQFVGHSFLDAATFETSVILKISIDTCRTEAIELSGEGREPARSSLNVWALSGNNSTIAYLFRRLVAPNSTAFVEDILIRNTSDLDVRVRIEPLAGWRYSEIALSHAGDRIAAGIYRDGLLWDPSSEHRVVIYNTSSGDLVANYPIDGRMGLAFSPDSKYLLAGQRLVEVGPNGSEKRVRARITLHLVDTGEQIGTGEFPWVKRPRMDPFVGTITKLAFIPDGREVIASTYETRIWTIHLPD